MDDYPLHKARREKIWSKREPWNKIYRDAYEFAIPHRRPGGEGTNKNPVDRLFDMTATTSVMYFAGSLQRDLFPAGQQPFTLQSGALARQKLGAGAARLDRELEKIAAGMYPFFLTGEWDMAVHEACIDLGVGTGAILPVKGDSQQPVLFVAIPFDEIAIGEDGFRRVNFVSWKQRMERQAIREAFPQGRFPDDFNDKAKATDEVTIYQDFVKRTGGNPYGWDFKVSIDNHPDFVASSWSKSQPIAVPRYYRVPGEAYGRGPVLLALPSIKTLNKAQELALKAAAIQMLGIWAYRSGGTFNPDTVRVGPGEFWPMQSTGGILGPDVSRIDPASGRMDVARMVIGNLQADVKQALYDVRIPEYEGTPRSASEIAGRLRQKAETHIGAFGRLADRFGDVDMTEAFRKLNEEHSALSAAAASEAERVTLNAQWKGATEDLAAMRDKVRGLYGFSNDTMARRAGRTAAIVSRFNVLTDLGGALYSATADMAGPVFRYGFASTFRHAWAPMAKSLLGGEVRQAVGRTRAQLKAMGIGAETFLGTRHNAFSAVNEVYAPQSRFERGLDYATAKYNVANLMAPWTDAMKVMGSMVSGGEISHAVEGIAKGTATAKQIRNLAEAGIDGAMARRIHAELMREGGSDVVKGVRLPNTEGWADAGARAAFEGALSRDVDIMVLTPGLEKPLFMSRPVVGLMTQYKSIVQAANERILYRGLQQRDGATLQGLVSAVALGMFAQTAYGLANGKDLPETPGDWVKEGVSRSGVLGWLGEINGSAAKFSPQLDLWRAIGATKPEARFSNRSFWGTVLGPTAGKIETLVGTAAKAGSGGDMAWTAGDTRAIRRAVFGQNHLLLRYLFDAGEEEVNEWMGIEPLKAR